MVAMGKMLFLLMNKNYNSNKTSMDSGCLGVGVGCWGGGGGGGGGRDGGAYVVMEHCHGTYAKPPKKLRRTLHFSVWVVVGSGIFFFSFLFP